MSARKECRLEMAGEPALMSGGRECRPADRPPTHGNQAERTRRALVVEWFFSLRRSQPQTYRLRHRKISS